MHDWNYVYQMEIHVITNNVPVSEKNDIENRIIKWLTNQSEINEWMNV